MWHRMYKCPLAPSQRHHISGLLLINVRYLSHGGGNHSDRVAPTKLHLIPDELLPEAVIRPHHGATGPHPPVGLQQRDAAVLHQVGHAQGGGAAHTGVTVHQSAAAALRSELDLICHLVKVVAEGRPRGVRDRDVDVFHLGRRRAASLGLTNVHDAGDLTPSQLRGIIGRSAVTEIQMVGDSAKTWETCKTRPMHEQRGTKRVHQEVSSSLAHAPDRKTKYVRARTLSPPAGRSSHWHFILISHLFLFIKRQKQKYKNPHIVFKPTFHLYMFNVPFCLISVLCLANCSKKRFRALLKVHIGNIIISTIKWNRNENMYTNIYIYLYKYRYKYRGSWVLIRNMLTCHISTAPTFTCLITNSFSVWEMKWK